ncbi:hypothetical protein M5E87_12080 [Flavonifractor plautii]|nr:hypothetical protein M5E87_12080 [Flavonifractor plautii]
MNAVLHTEIPPFFLWMAFGREAKAVETPAAYLDLTTKLSGTQIRFLITLTEKADKRACGGVRCRRDSRIRNTMAKYQNKLVFLIERSV